MTMALPSEAPAPARSRLSSLTVAVDGGDLTGVLEALSDTRTRGLALKLARSGTVFRAKLLALRPRPSSTVLECFLEEAAG
jgi:hypothetical protein